VCGPGVGCPVIRSHEFHGDAGTLRRVGLTRSREAAKGNAGGGVRCSVFGLASRGRESAGVSEVGGWRSAASMPHGRALSQPACLRALAWERFQGGWPTHPRPLSPVSRGRGEEFVFLVLCKSATAPLAPGRGEGTGVRGETILSPTPWLPRNWHLAGCRSHAKPRRREGKRRGLQ